jgi:hypothetical protein
MSCFICPHQTAGGRSSAGDQPISWLMFFTFAATIFIIAGGFIYFLRSQRNREIAEDALAGSDHPRVHKGTDGALPDLLGITVFAFIAMGLLTAGFKSKPALEQTQQPPPVGQPMPTR